jgi:hypothetical protein
MPMVSKKVSPELARAMRGAESDNKAPSNKSPKTG